MDLLQRKAIIEAVERDPTDETARLIAADFFEELGEYELCKYLREVDRKIRVSPVVEIDLKELLDSYDWEEVFGEGTGGNTNKQTDPCPPTCNVDTTPPIRNDVEKIIAAVNGENDGDEWVGVFLLKDGRYLLASGSCDYTGWD